MKIEIREIGIQRRNFYVFRKGVSRLQVKGISPNPGRIASWYFPPVFKTFASQQNSMKRHWNCSWFAEIVLPPEQDNPNIPPFFYLRMHRKMREKTWDLGWYKLGPDRMMAFEKVHPKRYMDVTVHKGAWHACYGIRLYSRNSLIMAVTTTKNIVVHSLRYAQTQTCVVPVIRTWN